MADHVINVFLFAFVSVSVCVLWSLDRCTVWFRNRVSGGES